MYKRQASCQKGIKSVIKYAAGAEIEIGEAWLSNEASSQIDKFGEIRN
jgi:hypothetical protein